MQYEFSFDDGHELDLKVASLLSKYNLTAIFYIVVNRVDTQGNLSWDQVKELEAQGHTIGSHTMSHPPDLKKLYDSELEYELETSRGLLESVLGHPIKDFCYPRGRFDQRVIDAVTRAGYLRARTTGGIGETDIKDQLKIPGTVHVYPRSDYLGTHWLKFAMDAFQKAKRRNGYFHLWGHSWEIENLGEWENLERFFKYVKQGR